MRAYVIAIVGLTVLAVSAQAKVFYKETFNEGDWSERWVASRTKVADGSAGVFKKTTGKWFGDSNDSGIQTAGMSFHGTEFRGACSLT